MAFISKIVNYIKIIIFTFAKAFPEVSSTGGRIFGMNVCWVL